MNGGKSHMRTERVDEALLVNYLLGRLSEEEQVKIENRAFADDEYLGAMEAAEADLIDGYVCGDLSASDRRDFERRFLTSPQRRNKMEFAKALARLVQEPKPSRPAVLRRASAWQTLVDLVGGWKPVLQCAAALAVVICVGGPALLIVQNAAMRSRVAALDARSRESERREQDLREQLREEQAHAGGLAAQLQNQSASQGTPPVSLALLTFPPGLSRAESLAKQARVNSTTQIVRIEIQLEPRDNFPRFRAEIQTRSGQEVLVRSNLSKLRTASGFAISFDVPATALPAGDYELALKGQTTDQLTDVGYYYFKVQRH